MISTRPFLALGMLAACGGGGGAAGPAPRPGDGTVASADGVMLHYRSEGAGEPTVVLVHCGGCDMTVWTSVLPALTPDHRVVMFDLPGHGKSGKNRTAWSVPSFAADVRTIIEHLGITRAILVGHSMSGPIVVEAAAEMPDRVAGVVTIDTLHDAGKADDPAEIAQFFAAMRADYRGTFGAYVRTLFPATADPALVQRMVDIELANDPAIAIPMLESVSHFSTREPFAKVKAPIIAINADLNPTNVEGNRALHAQYEARIMTGVGHWPMLEAPARFNAELARAVHELSAK